MKALILAALISGSAFAQQVNSGLGSFNWSAPANRIDTIQTGQFGHVTPQEIKDKVVIIEGVNYSNNSVIIDRSNPRLDISSITMSSGRQVEVTRVSGGDMGGGGRIVDVSSMSITNQQIISR